MTITYYKRFRMELDLALPIAKPVLPEGYRWIPWREALIDEHAAVKARCFQDELDAIIFPCLGDHRGCQRLMREIRRKPGFSPAATWLLAGTTGSPVGTIQGVVDVSSLGSIQNVGVIPTERGQGLGRALVCQALRGFRDSGVSRVYLEVTAENDPAVRLYRSLGFSKARTLYRSLEQD